MKLFSYDEPLNMPEGSVRGIVALLIVIGCFVYFIMYREFPEVLSLILTATLSYYFGYRTSSNKGKEREKSLPPAV